ncbi:MAG: protein kinase [Deltaproteobacteria bacterium]|nr:protein kinase [Deltaproteobacteria bacterium]
MKVCEALEFAHARGVIHRDIKPDNIMVGSHGQVYWMDWGICRMQSGVGDESQQVSLSPKAITGGDEEGTIIGSPASMAPEQALGWISKTDAQSNVFCLGAFLYQFLTGIPPYNEATANEAVKKAQVLTCAAPQTSLMAARYLPNGCVSVKPMMAGDKEERYASVAHLRNDLGALPHRRMVVRDLSL